MTDAAVVVVLAGPQAAGKSTIAAALHDELVGDGQPVALVELDRVAAVGSPQPPEWTTARAVFASMVSTRVRTSDTVIAEGLGSAGEVEELRERLSVEATVLTVAITTSFESAFARAQSDPTRGISRDRDFLERVYSSWGEELPAVGFDLVVDTRDVSVADAVTRVRRAMKTVRPSRAS